MEAVETLLEPFIKAAVYITTVVGAFAFEHKIVISIVMTLVIVFYRFLMANMLYVKRHDKADWVTWGVLFALHTINAFIVVPEIYLAVETSIIIFLFVYAFFTDDSNAVKSTIYDSNIVYDDNSDRFDNNANNELKERKRRKDAKVSRSLSFSRTHSKYGIPVLMSKFTFKKSVMASNEQFAKAVEHLNDYYRDYNWRRNLSKNGKRYEFTAEVKVNKISAIPFDKELSDSLDWYVVPLGAIDVSNKKAIKETPLVWMMHDPKTEGKSYKALAKTVTYPKAPQAFVVGKTGGGKSVLVTGMLAHWVNKAKTSKQVKLYLCDAKRMEFKPYESLEEVSSVAVTLQEAVDLTDEFCKEMHKRNGIIAKEGGNSIPLDGRVSLKRCIDINGHIFENHEIVDFKTKDGKLHRDRALNLKGRTDIAEINIPSDGEEENEEDSKGFGW